MKRVWVLAPFPEGDTSRSRQPDYRDPHQTASEWVRAKNAAQPKRGDRKTYEKISLEGLTRIDFTRGDRLYVHGHGGIARKWRNKLVGKDDEEFSPATLRAAMADVHPDIFKSATIDIRIASCYSAQNEFARSFARELGKVEGARGSVKGYRGQLNVVEMTKGVSRHGVHRDPPARKLANLTLESNRLIAFDDRSRTVNYLDKSDREAFRASKHRVEYRITPPRRGAR